MPAFLLAADTARNALVSTMTQPIQGVIKVVPAKALGTKVVRKPGLERLGKRIDIDGLIYLSQDDLKPIRPMLASSQLPLVAVAEVSFKIQVLILVEMEAAVAVL